MAFVPPFLRPLASSCRAVGTPTTSPCPFATLRRGVIFPTMRRAGIALLVLGSLAVLGAYVAVIAGVAVSLAPWWLASGTTAVLAGLASIGAARHGRRTPLLAATIIATFVSVGAGFMIPLAMPAPDASMPLLLGLPRPTAFLALFVYAIPLVLMPVAYGIAFEREVLNDDDLAQLREPR